jgi:hypothetical protein
VEGNKYQQHTIPEQAQLEGWGREMLPALPHVIQTFRDMRGLIVSMHRHRQVLP